MAKEKKHLIGEEDMSTGQHCESIRHLVIKGSEIWVITGYSRINVQKYILDVPYDSFDIMEIEGRISFSQSEWDKIKEYVDKARELGKIVTFKDCSIYEDDFLPIVFFEADSMVPIEKHKLMKKNNYEGVRFHSIESIKRCGEAKVNGERGWMRLLDGESI